MRAVLCGAYKDIVLPSATAPTEALQSRLERRSSRRAAARGWGPVEIAQTFNTVCTRIGVKQIGSLAAGRPHNSCHPSPVASSRTWIRGVRHRKMGKSFGERLYPTCPRPGSGHWRLSTPLWWKVRVRAAYPTCRQRWLRALFGAPLPWLRALASRRRPKGP